MKIAVRYFTRSGNTKKLADAIAKAVGVQAQDLSTPLDEKVDLLFLGSSVYAAGVDDAVKAFIADNADKIGKIAGFSTAAIIRSTFKQVKKLADEKGIAVIPQEFYCRGSFGPMHKNRPNEQDLAAAEAFAKGLAE